MTDGNWLTVPVGRAAPSRATAPTRRTVLAVVHNVTSATRLLDVLAMLESDPRIQVVFTWTRSSPFQHGVPELLTDLGAVVLPWDQATATPFDLAISTSHGGDLHRIQAPLVVLSHGIGYNKIFKQETGNRKQETGNRKQGADGDEAGGVFGLSPEWLLNDDAVVPSVLALSHPEQLDRLRSACPEAVPAAAIIGDPCYDRMLASLERRERYRRALSVAGGERLVVVTSTWGRDSLFGRVPELPSRLLAEMPADEYRVAAVLHPNIWHCHGPWQVESWLAACRRSGLNLIPPRDGWRAALIAADCVIGDHGSVTFYGAALGRPVLLAAFPPTEIDPASPVARLGAAAPTLDPTRPLAGQLDDVIASHTTDQYAAITDATTSVPGESADLLRGALYELMALPEPDRPTHVPVVPAAQAAQPDRPWRPGATALFAEVSIAQADPAESPLVSVARYPAELADRDGEAHLVVDIETPDPRVLEIADIVIGREEQLVEPPDEWLDRVLERYHGCLVAAAETSPAECLAAVRGGPTVAVSGDDARRIDPTIYASVLYALLTQDRTVGGMPPTVRINAGGSVVDASVRPTR